MCDSLFWKAILLFLLSYFLPSFHVLKKNNWLETIIKPYDLKKITIHGFRHSHCSLLFEMGTPIQVVQERLGHTNIKTTMDIYTHVTEKQRDKIADNFAKYVNF